ncbi:sugar transferase [Candidatus Uhrbacteria bacterium]|nr:sugar transferase [Candidatus Uhrbacteria bacterium]
MKRSELTISVLLVPLDYLALLGAAVFAYRLRFESVAEFRPIRFYLPLSEFMELAAIVALAWIAIFALAGCYATTARRSWRSEFARVMLASSTGFAFVLAAIVFSRELFASRFIVLAVWPLAIVCVFAVRLVVRAVERVLFSQGIGVHRIALIGTGRAADALADAFAARPGLGFRIVTRIPTFSNGASDTLIRAWAAKEIDEVIDATTPPNPKELHTLLDICDDHHIPIRYAADLLTAHTSRVVVDTFAGVPLIEPKRTPLEGWGRVVKRVFDCMVSTLLLIVLSPVLLLIAIAIALDSRGPILFRQQRVGQAGRPFTFLKFRSMRIGAHDEWDELRKRSDRSGIIPKIKNDPRVTRVGRLIRRWSLDELPQLFNVLTGSMSLVGPRPHLPEEVAEYQKHHRKVLALKPGITGLAQVSGRADLDFDEEVKVDTFYIERWSLGLDLVILLRTPFAVIRTKGAY